MWHVQDAGKCRSSPYLLNGGSSFAAHVLPDLQDGQTNRVCWKLGPNYPGSHQDRKDIFKPSVYLLHVQLPPQPWCEMRLLSKVPAPWQGLERQEHPPVARHGSQLSFLRLQHRQHQQNAYFTDRFLPSPHHHAEAVLDQKSCSCCHTVPPAALTYTVLFPRPTDEVTWELFTGLSHWQQEPGSRRLHLLNSHYYLLFFITQTWTVKLTTQTLYSFSFSTLPPPKKSIFKYFFYRYLVNLSFCHFITSV